MILDGFGARFGRFWDRQNGCKAEQVKLRKLMPRLSASSISGVVETSFGYKTGEKRYAETEDSFRMRFYGFSMDLGAIFGAKIEETSDPKSKRKSDAIREAVLAAKCGPGTD